MTGPDMQSISALLRKVLVGEENFVRLQNAVDHMIIGDIIPDEITDEARSELYEMQTVLELIAEHQATYMGTEHTYTPEKIISLLANFPAIKGL